MTSFQDLNLISPIQRAIADEKYETPTPIQEKTIPDVLNGRDVLGCAQTGTGKTAAFALPILNRLGRQNQKSVPNSPRVLVLAPTRELAVQIGDSFAAYGRHLKLRQALVYGGVSQAQQVRALSRGVHILIATPGRLLDLMGQGCISLRRLEVFVLDEADRMLDMGFLPDLKRIIRELPEQRQSLFFSATLPEEIIRLARGLLTDPVRVDVTPKTRCIELIEQRVMFVERSAKKALLKKILHSAGVGRALVFTKTKRGANLVARHLLLDGIDATAIHGNKSQNARQRALDDFRQDKVRVLVATDLAARGLDVDGITHVVNFELPQEAESYIHRIGRTGRAGASGIALTLCSAGETADLRAIERLLGRKLPVDAEHPRPQGAETETEPSANGRRRFSSKRSASGNSGPRRNGRNRKSAAGPDGGGRPRRLRRPRRRAHAAGKPEEQAR